MPIYEFECRECKHITEDLSPFVHEVPRVSCEKCYGVAERIVSRMQDIKPAWEEYWDDNLTSGSGSILVKGRKHREELMKRQGLTEKPYDPTRKRLLIEEREERKIQTLKERGEFNG